MATLLTPPDRSGYAVTPGNETLRAKLDGGASRFRADILDAAFEVDCNWILDPEQYKYYCAFYRTATKRGSLPFDVSLRIDDSDAADYTAHFTSPYKLTGQEGLAYYVSATLEVSKAVNPDEEDEDNDIIDAYEAAHS